jgi:uncharacterized membrane protein YedE/YeeE
MLAPYYKLGFIGESGMIIIALLAGLAFGYILVSVGMGNSRKIAAMFYGEDWSVMKIMFSAVVTTMVLTYTAYYFGLVDVNLIQMANVNLAGQIIGGGLIGAGMTIGGYCPGTSIAASVNRKIDAWIYIGGFMVGIFIYGLAYPWISEYVLSANLGKLTLSDAFGLSYGTLAFIVVGIALMTFFILEKTEGKLYAKVTAKLSTK